MKPDIHSYIRPGVHAHLVGIGGVSMSPLAEVLLGAGMTITGSDMQEGAAVAHLRGLGIPVAIGHRGENVAGAQCVIRTAAVHDDNPEIAAAHAQGIPVFERAEAWGSLMTQYPNALCVSGTHGKTTTTSMCTHIFLAARRDPTVMIGGVLPILGGGHRVGKGDTVILESCEYCNSFLSFFPTVAVILNVDADHLDFFKDLDDVKASFRRFAALVPQDTGVVVANRDDGNTRDVVAGLDRKVVTFGLEEGDVHAANLTWNKGLPTFQVVYQGQVAATVSLSVPGLHNVSNALAAAAAALVLGVEPKAIEEGLAEFHGAGRRFEHKGSYHGAEIYDDYAHHPQELRALLTTVKGLGYRRVICAFQPHTYTRTKELFDQFVDVLKLADLAVLAEIYPARETDTLGMSSRLLADQIPGAIYCPDLDAVTRTLAELAQPGDLILTVGAGDIVRASAPLLS